MNRLAVFMALLLSASGATAGIVTLQATQGQVPLPNPDPEPEPQGNSTGSSNSTAGGNPGGGHGGPSPEPEPEPSHTHANGTSSNSTGGTGGSSGGSGCPEHDHDPCGSCEDACQTLIMEDERATGPISSIWEWKVDPDMDSLTVLVDVGRYEPALTQDLRVSLHNGAGQLVASGTRTGVTAAEWGTVLAYQVDRFQDGWSPGTWVLTMESQMMVGSYSVHVMADCPEGHAYY